jgi:hypothetical protein
MNEFKPGVSPNKKTISRQVSEAKPYQAWFYLYKNLSVLCVLCVFLNLLKGEEKWTLEISL